MIDEKIFLEFIKTNFFCDLINYTLWKNSFVVIVLKINVF